MMGTKNSEVLEKVLDNLISLSAKSTSKAYSLLVVSMLVEKLSSKYSFLKNVRIKTTSFSSSSKSISVGSEVDETDEAGFGKALGEIISSLSKPLGAGEEKFLKELKNSLGTSYELKLKNMGVNI